MRTFWGVLLILAVMAGGVFLTGCTVVRTGNDIPLPSVTVSPATAWVQTGESAQFTATVVSTTSTTLTWSVNGTLGGNSIVGTINSTGYYTAPTSVPSPAAVTVTATSSAETNPHGSAIVTITPPAVAAVTVAPTNVSAVAGSSVQFAATVTGSPNTGVSWSVNGVVGGSSTVGVITSGGLYTAPATPPSPVTVAVTATSEADTSQSASITLTVTANNTAALFVNFGLNGYSGNPSAATYNELLTTVTVCLPGTIDCQIVPNILVDTHSVGLRVLNSALTTVPATELLTITDSKGDQVEECVQFPDSSYAWGPVVVADVHVAGETASSVPIQVIGDTSYNVPAPNCLPLGTGPSLASVATLGANGILGVGPSVQDCGPNCAAGQTSLPYPYYVCPKSACQTAYVPVVQQVANPVALFAKDNNGVQISLPAIASTGAPSLPYVNADGTGLVPAGLLIFGVGTESNNALGSATLLALDSNGHFPDVVYNGTSYASGGYVDSRSNALYVSDAQTLGIEVCGDNAYYCPVAVMPVSLTVCGGNSAQGANSPCGANVAFETVTLNIANADTLFSTNPGFAAFSDLGRPSGTGISSDYFDLGLPFFFGRSVFVGIAGTTVPSGASAPNGYVAF